MSVKLTLTSLLIFLFTSIGLAKSEVREKLFEPLDSGLKTGLIAVGVMVNDGENWLRGAVVTIYQNDKIISSNTSTNDSITVLSLVDYNFQEVKIEVKMKGYRTERIMGVKLKNGGIYRIKLTPGEGVQEGRLESRISNESKQKMTFCERRTQRKIKRLENRLERIEKRKLNLKEKQK